jgi:NitT/TauT family transport system ATP-binding protein
MTAEPTADRLGPPGDDAVAVPAEPLPLDRRSAAEAGARPIAISVQAVDKVFSGQRSVKALEQVSFDVPVGTFVSLIGPSGCGKSTLLRLVAGLSTPTGGRILANGLEPREARRRRLFGIVFQSPVLFDWRTVAANIALPLQILKRPRAEIDVRVAELAELVGLSEFVNHHPYELSGGMQQRVAIARALSFGPPFLLMDEPFGALDMITRDRMATELLRIWSSTPDTTVMFITHSIPEAIMLSDQVVVISARPGRVARIVHIDLPRPRTEEIRESRAFYEYDRELRRLLIEGEAGGQ